MTLAMSCADNAGRGSGNRDGPLRSQAKVRHLQAKHPRGSETGAEVFEQGIPCA